MAEAGGPARGLRGRSDDGATRTARPRSGAGPGAARRAAENGTPYPGLRGAPAVVRALRHGHRGTVRMEGPVPGDPLSDRRGDLPGGATGSAIPAWPRDARVDRAFAGFGGRLRSRAAAR